MDTLYAHGYTHLSLNPYQGVSCATMKDLKLPMPLLKEVMVYSKPDSVAF